MSDWFIPAIYVLAAVLYLIGRYYYHRYLHPVETRKAVGPTYWGLYADENPCENPDEVAVPLQPVCSSLPTARGDAYKDFAGDTAPLADSDSARWVH